MSDEAADDFDLTTACWREGGATLTAMITRVSPDGEEVDVEVAYYVVDGKAIFEGDISLGNAETVATREAARKRHDFSFIVTPSLGRTWPSGIVPYDSDPATKARADWLAAYFADNTPIRLVPYDGTQHDYLMFLSGPGNETTVGRQGGPQQVHLAQAASAGDAIHEVCHALGMWHEHTRPDRDTYITVFMANIVLSDQPAFTPLPASAGNYASPYDYNSIMHYPSWASALPGKASMLTKAGATIGARSGLSSGDLAGLKTLYPGLQWQ